MKHGALCRSLHVVPQRWLPGLSAVFRCLMVSGSVVYAEKQWPFELLQLRTVIC